MNTKSSQLLKGRSKNAARLSRGSDDVGAFCGDCLFLGRPAPDAAAAFFFSFFSLPPSPATASFLSCLRPVLPDGSLPL